MVPCLLPPVASSPKAVSENMQKLQEDREFVQKLVQETLGEVGTSGTFNGLRARLQDCHQEKTGMEEAILRWAHARPLESCHAPLQCCDKFPSAAVTVLLEYCFPLPGRRSVSSGCGSWRGNWWCSGRRKKKRLLSVEGYNPQKWWPEE